MVELEVLHPRAEYTFASNAFVTQAWQCVVDEVDVCGALSG